MAAECRVPRERDETCTEPGRAALGLPVRFNLYGFRTP